MVSSTVNSRSLTEEPQSLQSLDADLADCREALRCGSRSFFAASFLLPPAFRESASALYAFCREADDAIDGNPDPAAGLASLRHRLDVIYGRGKPARAADRALAAVVEAHGLPRALLDALLEGFAWDADGRSYEDLSGVFDYAARVAGAVGVMMAVLMGVRDPQVLARACDLGVAMQLSNIARDVGEDARFGRLYLPRQWLREAGVDPERFLAAPEPSAAIADIVRRLLAQADHLYRRAESGIARLPVGCRPGIYAARLLYAEIGAEVARRGFDGVSSRAVVSPMRKMKLLMRVQGTLMLSTEHLQAPVLPETRFLIEAAAAAPLTASTAKSLSGGPIRRAGRRLVWMLELFEELDRRERLRALSASSGDESLA